MSEREREIKGVKGQMQERRDRGSERQRLRVEREIMI